MLFRFIHALKRKNGFLMISKEKIMSFRKIKKFRYLNIFFIFGNPVLEFRSGAVPCMVRLIKTLHINKPT